ncbi:DUF6499 domain-containing protein [Mesorhizobium sp.]|uniref:transcriptional regulator domain-containing protein n=1 Tax=Mesorhizobium sp. TaxID=1871066 RepID=UPI0026B72E63
MIPTKGTAADWPDWRDKNSYDYTAHLTRRGWAWEFLRRDPAFRHHLAIALERAKWRESGAATSWSRPST